MLTKPLHWLLLILTVILINVVGVNLIQNYVYYPLETSIYDNHNEYLTVAKQDILKNFQESNETQWQDLSLKLENKYDAAASILNRTPGYVDKIILHELTLTQSQQGYIDLSMATVYYPLNDEYVLELGPIPYEGALVWFSDWLPWLTTSLINMTLLFLVLRFNQQQQANALSRLKHFPISFDTPNNLNKSLQQTQSYLLRIQDQNEQRLLLQQDLLHGVAHEFRSPMARIQFALDMLEDADTNERPQLQHSMHAALTDLDELVKELLYYAKLKDGNANITLSEVQVNELIKNTITKVSPFYPDISFQYEAGPELNVTLDNNLFTRLLVNVLRNAGRFANSLCKISVTQDSQNTNFLIEDDGLGIPPGKNERIFEPFTRLDPSRSRDSGGCGLGLAIVASIAAKHKAQISVLSQEDKKRNLPGAAFYIQVPHSLETKSDIL